MNYKQELPTDAEAALDAYIDRIKKIRWFKPAADIKRENVDTAIKAAISAFGVEASIEYRNLKTPADWDAARDAAWGAADVLATFTPTYKGKTPFVRLVDLYEMGLYPIGVVDGKFIVYVPPSKMEFPDELI